MNPIRRLAVALLVVLVASAVPASGQHVAAVHVEHPWARPLPAVARNGAAYLTVRIEGAADRLLGATSTVASRVEIHSQVNDGGVMKMRHLEDGVPVAAGEALTFEPGGLHLMLVGLVRPLDEGSEFPLSLRFEHAGEVTVTVLVREPSSTASPAQGHAGHAEHGGHDPKGD